MFQSTTAGDVGEASSHLRQPHGASGTVTPMGASAKGLSSLKAKGDSPEYIPHASVFISEEMGICCLQTLKD